MKGAILDDCGLHMAQADNVITAIADLDAGTEIASEEATIELVEDVPFGHKIALVPIGPGDTIVKYGEPIGEAVASIEPGEWVHTHNCESARGRGDRSTTDGEVA